MTDEVQKTTEELTNEYMSQSMPAISQVVYTPSASSHNTENDPHFGGPMCYDCCGYHCCIELLGLVAVLLICCAYTTDGTCCDYCYWPL